MKDEPVFEYHAEEAVVDLELPDRTKRQIKIKSGWSFGTGGHETTRLCLGALQELFRTEKIYSVLDVGCGSGILSIASSILGAREVVGIDIDSSIVVEARTNARINNVSDKTAFVAQPITENNQEYDLVVANILLETIERLIENIYDKLRINGYFIASGIRENEITAAVNLMETAGFEKINVFRESDWSALVLIKK